MYNLLLSLLCEGESNFANDEESEFILPGTHGWWSGPFEEVVVGVLLDSSTL